MSSLPSSLSIRVAAISDAAAINRIYNYYVLNSCITLDLAPWTEAARETWLRTFMDDTNVYCLVVAELEGVVVGFAYNSPFRAKAGYRLSTETTIYTDSQRQTPGIGSALYRALFMNLKKTNLNRAFAAISLPNDRSLELHRQFGFTQIGTLTEVGSKFGNYVDVVWLEKKLNP